GCITPTCTNLCPGTYIINISDSLGCTGVDSVIITEPIVLTSAIIVTPASCNAVCDGTAFATASGGTVNYNYSWNTVPVQNSATAIGLCAGNYTCTVTDSNDCTTSIVAIITEPSAVVIDAIPDVSICTGGNVNLIASASGGNSGGYNYSWDAPGNLGFANTASINVNPLSITTYTVNASDILHNCPAAPVTVTVGINPLPTANAGSTQFACPGIGITLAGSIGGSAISGTWSGGTGTFSPDNNALNAVYTPSVAEYAADSVLLTLTTDDPPGSCTPSLSNVTFHFYENPVVSFTADTLEGCPVFCTNFTNSTVIVGGDSVVSLIWDFGDALPGSTIQNPSHCFLSSGLYDIALTATSNHGCISTHVETHFIEVFNLPVAAFTTSPNPVTVLDPTVTMTNQSSSDVNYWDWNFGDGTTLSPNISSTEHLYPYSIPFNYQVTLIVQNANGCYDTVIHEIIIGPEFSFFIPNSFTPNGDGFNDYFFGSGVGIKKYEFWIFDRWGNLIFDCKVNGLPQSQPCLWNGIVEAGGQDFNGNSSKLAQIDVYVWKVELTDFFDKKHNYVGTVTIVK
ncbi:MAG: gliding motility-associated C-terminal domain-containing protein, partial [Bacteroidetes bacterium]|nr:gliding motility-associated C-terminal domain-containing protein [Bacteroidota bacterium]